MAASEASAARELRASSLVLAVAASLFAVVWLIAIAGDPTDASALAFFLAAYGGALLLGIGLVIAASSRRDMFGRLGFAGALVIFVAALNISILSFVAGVIGLTLMGAAAARTDKRVLPGLIVLGVGLIGFGVRVEANADAYLIFMPVIAAGSAILAATFRQL